MSVRDLDAVLRDAVARLFVEWIYRVRAGDAVELTGRVISLRDASAARLAKAIERRGATYTGSPAQWRR